MKTTLISFLRSLVLPVLAILISASSLPFSGTHAIVSISQPLLWISECITCGQDPNFGMHAAIDVDLGGAPHVVYYAPGGQRYAYQDAAGWHFENIVETCLSTDILFIKVGPDAKVHLLSHCGDDEINYTYRDESGWHSQVIFRNTDFVWNGAPAVSLYVNSLALDSAGRPHGTVTGLYAKGTVALVHHIYLEDTGWQAELVGPGEDGALAIGPGDTLHVARAYRTWDYHPFPVDSFLEYSYYDDQGWRSEELAHPATGLDVAIAVDSSGRPHLVTNGGLPPGNYFRKESGGWSREIVNVTSQPILLLDGDDTPSIGSTPYFFNLIFATKREQVWYSVDLGASDLAFNTVHGMALDAAGNAHLVYRQKDTYDVIYLRPYTGPVYSVYLTAINK